MRKLLKRLKQMFRLTGQVKPEQVLHWGVNQRPGEEPILVGLYEPCPHCPEGEQRGRMQVMTRPKGRRRTREEITGAKPIDTTVLVHSLVCDACGWQPAASTWEQVVRTDIEEQPESPKEDRVEDVPAAEPEGDLSAGFWLLLKPGLSRFNRKIEDQVKVFLAYHPVEVSEFELPYLMTDIVNGILQPVEWVGHPQGWKVVPLDEIDLDGMLEQTRQARMVSDIVREPG